MTQAKKEVLGVDIGGTNIKAGRVREGKVLQKQVLGVSRNDPEATTLKKLFRSIDAVMANSVEAIGIGVPAVVDPDTGVVYDVQNIPAWKEVPLKDLVQQRYALPVYINNDANCFALGEKHFGRARGFSNYVALSLGTGLGMGILIDNKLYNGVLCGAGEIGMLPYRDGIMEHYTGSFFFDEKYNLSARALYKKALHNDPTALEAFKAYGYHLGEAVKVILYLYAPEAIILGGSISKAYSFFKGALENAMDSFAYQKQLEHLKLEISDIVDSPELGAAALCL